MLIQQKYTPAQVAQIILSDENLIFCANEFHLYRDGCYRKWHEMKVFKHIKERVGNEWSSNKINEVITHLKSDCFKEADEIENYLFLNLRNGLFNVDSFECIDHVPEVLSTIQLQIKYDPEATCNTWLQSLNEIFEGDHEKIAILQEFFGLCLTTETKFEKVLFLLGEGANGKSVILYILQQMLGEENYSAIPLEKFQSGPYLANLFSKLANISTETSAKASVYDSNIKAISTGESITADEKFKRPFKFRPYCKLIFALNTMPRVDDKTAAFFRRLLILKFNRIFKEEEQNKTLKFDLIKELNGIFLWSLHGLKRLRQRGYFLIPNEMKSEIEEYKKENNNVILFIEEKCELSLEFTESKDDLYRYYSEWCKENNNCPLAKKKFGKELMKLYSEIKDGRNAIDRYWQGIRKIPFQ